MLISLLAQNNHLLRGVVGAVFSVVGKELTAPAMYSLFAVITSIYYCMPGCVVSKAPS